ALQPKSFFDRLPKQPTLTGMAAYLFTASVVVLFWVLYHDAMRTGPLLWLAGLLLIATIAWWIAASRAGERGGQPERSASRHVFLDAQRRSGLPRTASRLRSTALRIGISKRDSVTRSRSLECDHIFEKGTRRGRDACPKSSPCPFQLVNCPTQKGIST